MVTTIQADGLVGLCVEFSETFVTLDEIVYHFKFKDYS